MPGIAACFLCGVKENIREEFVRLSSDRVEEVHKIFKGTWAEDLVCSFEPGNRYRITICNNCRGKAGVQLG